MGKGALRGTEKGFLATEGGRAPNGTAEPKVLAFPLSFGILSTPVQF